MKTTTNKFTTEDLNYLMNVLYEIDKSNWCEESIKEYKQLYQKLENQYQKKWSLGMPILNKETL